MHALDLAPVFLVSAALAVSGCHRAPSDSNGELVIFHAGSLAVPLREVSQLFEAQHPGVKVQAEAAGSRDTARKVSDLNRPCDVLAVADYQVVDELLMPAHADFNIRFAANELSIAYTERSKLADQITTQNWHQILLRPEVVVGRADPNRDPCGYRTVMLLQLAEKHYRAPGLAEQLMAKDQRFIRPKETDLLALLESGEIDYLFIYRSVIEQHKLNRIALPDEVNLRAPAKQSLYQTASAEITGKRPGEMIVEKGAAIVYAVTIPTNCPSPALARAYVALLLSAEGQAVLARNGQEPLRPAEARGFERLPAELKSLCRPAERP